MRLSHLLGAALLAASASGCLNLDVFVFRAKKAPPEENLMAGAKLVPERLREYVTDVAVPGGTTVEVYVAKHDGGEGDLGDPRRNGIGIFYCHGQSSHLGTHHPRVEALWKLGYTVAIFTWRGAGHTPGTPTELGVYADAKAAREWFEARADLGMSPDRVGLYGRSLGSAICLSQVRDRSPKALALESPIGSLQDIIDDSLGVEAPSEWFFDSVMDNYATIPAYTGSLLVMHGLADDFVQPRYGRELFALSEGHASPRELWLVEGANHGTVPCADFTSSPVVNDCTGGFSPTYEQKVTELYDAAFEQP
jgi:hypothetical protein